MIPPQKEQELIKYVSNNLLGEYERGINDCATFAAGALDIITGNSFKERIVGKYNDEKTALEYIKTHGSIAQHWIAEGCYKLDNNLLMTTGDFPVFRDNKILAIGVCIGDKTAINTNTHGVVLCKNSSLENIEGVYRWG